VRLLRLLLAVGLVAGFVLGPGVVHAGAVVIVSTSGTAVPATGPQTQDGRFNPDSSASECSAFDFSPTRTNQGTAFHYTNHTFRSSLTHPVCLTVTLTTSCTGANEIFSVAYAGAFNPADPLENYAADIGSVVSASGSYSFASPVGPFSIVVHEVHSGGGCSPYSLSVTSDGPWADNRPAIVGNAPAIGAVITGNDATWKTNPAAPTVQRRWRRCDAVGATCTDIPGATGTTYTPTDADLGHTLRFRNIATDGDGTSTSDSLFVEPFIPFETHDAESLGPGDRVHNGIFVRDNVESRCGAPKSVPTLVQPASSFLYDPFPVRSLLNEPVCLVVRTLPSCGSGVTPAIYDPAFAPASGIATNYAANSGLPFNSAALASAILQPGGARDVAVSIGSSAGACTAYSATLGADAPFAGARPALGGSPIEGGTLTASDGSWSGSPAIGHSWLSCDASGDGCTPIDAANAASYTPTAADVGRRLRARVTATQGRSVSSDSAPTEVVAAAPVDRTPPSGSVRLGSRNLRKARRSGHIPVTVKSDEACSALIELRIAKRLAKRLKLKGTRIARVAGAVPAGRAATLRAKLTRAARRALRGRRSLKLRVAAVLTDSSGNRSTLAKRGTLKRPRR
jgi:hypothetical protein